MKPIPFSDIEFPPSQSRVLELLFDGVPLEEICLRTGNSMVSVKTICSRLGTTISTTMPHVTQYHLFAQEFLRRQSAIIQGGRTLTRTLTDAEIDARLAQFAAEDRAAYAKGATA